MVLQTHQTLSLHPENPHYFLFRGKPTILVTSGEHYGAVINLDFDYLTYLNELQLMGFNLTRLFTGAYLEYKEFFNAGGNTLAPQPSRFILLDLTYPLINSDIALRIIKMPRRNRYVKL